MRPVAAFLACMALGVSCDTSPGRACGEPGKADVLTVSGANGATLQRRSAFPREVEVRAGVLYDYGSVELATVDDSARPPDAPVRSEDEPDGNALIGSGDRPWRVEGAAGTVVEATRGGLVVIRGRDDQLRGIRLSDGRVEWNAFRDHRIRLSLVEARGAVLYGFGHAVTPGQEAALEVFSLDNATGRVRWRHPIGGGKDVRAASLAVTGGRAIVGLESRGDTEPLATRLLALDAATGRLAWTAALSRPTIRGLYPAKGHLVVVNQDRSTPCPY